MMTMKQMTIGSQMYNVATYEEFCNNKDLYNNSYTAVQLCGYVLPVRTGFDIDKPGIKSGNAINIINLPPEEEREKYDEKNITNFGDSQNIEELLGKVKLVRDQQKELLVTSENFTTPNISNLDKPLMKLIKTAVIEKHINIDQYAGKFGDNFLNDKRILKQNDITFKMAERYANCLDMKMTVTLEDKNPDVANPLGKVLTQVITGPQ